MPPVIPHKTHDPGATNWLPMDSGWRSKRAQAARSRGAVKNVRIKKTVAEEGLLVFLVQHCAHDRANNDFDYRPQGRHDSEVL